MPRPESNPRPLDHKSNALPLHHRVTLHSRAYLKNPTCTKTPGPDPTGALQHYTRPISWWFTPSPRTPSRTALRASSSPCPAMLISFRRHWKVSKKVNIYHINFHRSRLFPIVIKLRFCEFSIACIQILDGWK